MLSLKGPKYSSAGAGPLAKHASGANVDMHANANAKMRGSIVLQLSEYDARSYTCLLGRIDGSNRLFIYCLLACCAASCARRFNSRCRAFAMRARSIA